MFTNLLPISDKLMNVQYKDFAKSHYLKNFMKKYPGIQWKVTEESIKQDLSRLRMRNNKTQFSSQIDQLKYNNYHWLAKYDFRIAKTQESSKSSGNRCVVHIDNLNDLLEILLIYSKTDLPKNMGETAHINEILNSQYKNVMKHFENNMKG